MLISELLARLTNAGYQVRAEADTLHLEYGLDGSPDPAVVRPLLEEAKQQKVDLLRLLQYHRLPSDEADALSVLPLSQIEEEGQRARLFSKVLNEAVWIVSTKAATADLPAGEISYTVPECRLLAARVPTPEELRVLHATKKHLDGKIE